MLKSIAIKAKKIVTDHPTESALAGFLIASYVAVYTLGRYHGNVTIDMRIKAMPTNDYVHVGYYVIK